MRKPASKLDTTADMALPKAACPAILLSMPIIGAGILISSITMITSNPPVYLLAMTGLLFALWTFSLWRMQTVLPLTTRKKSLLTPLQSVLLGTLGGPLAPYLALQIIHACIALLGIIGQNVAQVFPADMPILQSAIWLLGSSSTMAAIASGVVVAFICQQRLALNIEVLSANLPESKRSPRLSISALAMTLCLASPACMWVLGSTSSLTGLEQDWTARLYLGVFISFLGAFGILAWWQHRLQTSLIDASETSSSSASSQQSSSAA